MWGSGVLGGTNGRNHCLRVWEPRGKTMLDNQSVKAVFDNSVGKSPKTSLNHRKMTNSRGKTILDNQGVRTIYEKTKKSVGKTWENYN